MCVCVCVCVQHYLNGVRLSIHILILSHTYIPVYHACTCQYENKCAKLLLCTNARIHTYTFIHIHTCVRANARYCFVLEICVYV